MGGLFFGHPDFSRNFFLLGLVLHLGMGGRISLRTMMKMEAFDILMLCLLTFEISDDQEGTNFYTLGP